MKTLSISITLEWLVCPTIWHRLKRLRAYSCTHACISVIFENVRSAYYHHWSAPVIIETRLCFPTVERGINATAIVGTEILNSVISQLRKCTVGQVRNGYAGDARCAHKVSLFHSSPSRSSFRAFSLSPLSGGFYWRSVVRPSGHPPREMRYCRDKQCVPPSSSRRFFLFFHFFCYSRRHIHGHEIFQRSVFLQFKSLGSYTRL